MNLPAELIEKICSNLRTKDLIPLLSIPKMREVVKKRIFHTVRFDENLRVPPKNTLKYIRRFECYDVRFSDVHRVISHIPNLQQLILDDDCRKDQELAIPEVHTLILGNSMSSELVLPEGPFKMLGITITNKNWRSLKNLKAQTLHITIESYQAFIYILPYLNCKELYIYGDDYDEILNENWRSSITFDKLGLCGILPSKFVHNLLKYTSSKTLVLELTEIYGQWKSALSSHKKVHILIHEDSIIEDQWNYPIDTLHINGTILLEANLMCAWAKHIVFEKCVSGILEENLASLIQNDLSRLELIVFKDYNSKISKARFPLDLINYRFVNKVQ